MARRKETVSITGNMVQVFAADTTSSTGAGYSGLAYNTSGLTLKYRREGSSTYVTCTLLAGTLGTFGAGTGVSTNATLIATGGIVGMYEIGLPDVAFASGARWVIFEITGVIGCLVAPIEIELDKIDYQDSVRGGMTAFPSVNSGGNGGLPVLNSSLRISANMTAILDTTLSETSAGYLSSGFKFVFDTGVRNFNISSVINTGDPYARLGAPVNAISISDDISRKLATTAYTAPPTVTQIAVGVAGEIINEADGDMVLQAIVNAINGADINLQGLSTTAIASAVKTAIEASGSSIALIKLQADKIGTNNADSPNEIFAQNKVANLPTIPASQSDVTSATSTLTTAINSRASQTSVNGLPSTASIITAWFTALLTSTDFNTVGSIGAKFKAWLFGSDGKSILSSDQTTLPDVVLATSQPRYAPAKASDLNVTVNPTSVTVNPSLTGDQSDTMLNLRSMIESDGSLKRFNAEALNQAPSGGGGSSASYTQDDRVRDLEILAQVGALGGLPIFRNSPVGKGADITVHKGYANTMLRGDAIGPFIFSENLTGASMELWETYSDSPVGNAVVSYDSQTLKYTVYFETSMDSWNQTGIRNYSIGARFSGDPSRFNLHFELSGVLNVLGH